MSSINNFTFENPEEQVNTAIKLLLNAYEVKSEYYENEIKRMNEEFKIKLDDYEREYLNLSKEKENLEMNLENLINENKNISEKFEIAINENKKLENFKISILSSINDGGSNSNNFNNFNNFNNLENINRGVNNNFKSGNVTPINNFQINSLRPNQSSNTISNNKFIKKIRNSSDHESNTNNKDNRIDKLIEKLNDSINNRIYSPDEEINENNSKNNNYLHHNNTNNIITNQSHKNYKTDYEFNQVETPKNYTSINTSKDYYSKNNYNNKFIPDLKKSKRTNTNRTIENISREEESNESDKKSNQYVLSSKFFNECRLKMKEEEYSKLIATLRSCNNNKIDKSEAFLRIEKLLFNYHNLLRDFKNIFPPN